MLSTALVHEIDRLLREGELSQRQIAARLRVSRGTVGAIASGERGLHGKERRKTYTPLTPSSPPTRCPRCGYRVYVPCIICSVREHRRGQRLLQLIAADARTQKNGSRQGAKAPRKCRSTCASLGGNR
jgi:hypothetical protein